MTDARAAWTAATVIAELEEAGRTLLALPHSGYSTLCRTSSLSFAREVIEAYGWQPAEARASPPSGEAISRMDVALGWLRHIPQDRYVLRRILGARALLHPVRERHLYSWRKLGRVLGADHKAVQKWHAEGVGLIVDALNRARSGRAA